MWDRMRLYGLGLKDEFQRGDGRTASWSELRGGPRKRWVTISSDSHISSGLERDIITVQIRIYIILNTITIIRRWLALSTYLNHVVRHSKQGSIQRWRFTFIDRLKVEIG